MRKPISTGRDMASSEGLYSETDLLPLSGLQHLVYCERQWALIHIEQQWAENRLTAQGRVLHEVVDEAPDESRRGVRIVRSLALRSMRLGITGKADVVEFPLYGDGATLNGVGSRVAPLSRARGLKQTVSDKAIKREASRPFVSVS